MEISQKQFNMLDCLIMNPNITQRELQAKTKYSLGTVNSVIKELNLLGYIKNNTVTESGIEALEPYRVKKAVFIAAGFSSRLAPVTLNTPKPLVRVKGKRIIDGLIDACLGIGINDIYIVRGYLSEQFDQLLYKYPFLKFLENPVYNETNNISSAMCARYLLSNAYVFEADLLISNPAVIKKYNYSSNFLGFKKERTDDWCFIVKDGIIKEQKVGGLNCYQEVGISYWTDTDGKKLSEHINKAYEMPGGRERYWDQVPFVVFPDEYKVELRECSESDVIEIDTFKELKAIDKAYNIT